MVERLGRTQPLPLRWQSVRAAGGDLHRLAQYAGRSFVHDRGAQIAAALTYHTLFSLLPMLAMALWALKNFVGPSELAVFKDQIVSVVGDWLSAPPRVDEAAAAVAGAAGEASSMAREAQYDQVLTQVDENLAKLLDDLQAINFQRIGGVGVLLFVYASTALLSMVEHSFNQICGAPSGRPWYRRIPLYYTTLTLGPI
ncbi:MAG: hypothetical protein AAFX85_04490, partial [Pseudomonadota bacterium]